MLTYIFFKRWSAHAWHVSIWVPTNMANYWNSYGVSETIELGIYMASVDFDYVIELAIGLVSWTESNEDIMNKKFMRRMRNPPTNTKNWSPPLYNEIDTKWDRSQKDVRRYHLLKPRLSAIMKTTSNQTRKGCAKFSQLC